MDSTKRRITAALAPLLLAAAPAVSLACGYHDPIVLAQGMLNWTYPDSLHVTGAVWSAQRQGVLAMPDPERLQARGPQRERLDKEAFWKATQALHALGDAFGQSRENEADLALLLVEPMLWTRFVRIEEGVEVKSHLTGGAESGDLVIITDAPVLHAVDDGTLSIAKANEMGLVRLYGEPSQQQAFLSSCGHIGNEPLPEVSQRDLLRRMRSQSMGLTSENAGGEDADTNHPAPGPGPGPGPTGR